MKRIKQSMILLGILTQLLIDLTFGLVITLAVTIIVFPFSFIYQRIKVAYFEAIIQITKI